MRFSKLYEELKFDDVFPVASNAEVAARKEQYVAIKLKEAFDVKKTKLPDGTWHIHGDLEISRCELTSLKELNVSIVDGYFYCYNNKLTTLEGGPKKVGGSFSCSFNKLTSLKGSPIEVNGEFFACCDNELTSLEGCPKEIRGNFDCTYNKLTSLKGCPAIIDGDFSGFANTKKFTIKDVRTECDVKGDIRI